MKILRKILKPCLIFAMIIAISACQNNSAETEKPSKIYLYGEEHGSKEDTEKEFALWKDYYDKEGMRNLFLEVPNFVAGYLNRWMDEDDDQILEILRDQYKYAQGNKLKHYGTLLRRIKKECPETVFYGTDISEFNDSLGLGYLKLLDKNKDKTEIDRVKEVMDQGDRRDAYIKEYKENQEDTHLARIADYREQMLVENFIYEFDNLEDKRIMGIYGAYHVANPENLQFGEAEIMADQLKSHYGDIVSTNILAEME
ncbi:hypothetical protein [Anaerococcus sp. Marseille-Q7828]|uniref:hypothetical protein n=1 Tax=Anaerococcus sp. Marseille-Q7828 TaxID=3036300 RepID=UPI0024AD583C|nr:hypothetical protein [Anaerococcus sp. Marseille-Q7828]